MIGCWDWLHNRLQVIQKGRFELCGGTVSRRYLFSFAMLTPRGRTPSS